MRYLWLITLFSVAFFDLFAIIGWAISGPIPDDTVNPSLILISPVTGSTWYIGQTEDIIWSAEDTNLQAENIFISYSLDGGNSYIPLAEPTSNTGSFVWEIPSPESDNGRILIRVSDSFGNIAQVVSPLCISFVPPLQVENLNIDISNGVDAVISWDPVTQTIFSDSVAPDGYLLFCSETPTRNESAYYLLANTPELTYTYSNAAGLYGKLFFQVIAYKDYGSRLTSALAQAGRVSSVKPKTKLTMAEVKYMLSKHEKKGAK